MTWPWESLHVEALAWYDCWLKGRDTGILEGPAFRYWLPGAEEWRASEVWPPGGLALRSLALRADGALDEEEASKGDRSLMVFAPGLSLPAGTDSDPPSALTWTSAPLESDLELIGDLEVELHATSTAIDTAWIVTLQDVAPNDDVSDVTAGWLRASLREPAACLSTPGSPTVSCRRADAVVPGCLTVYRIPLVPNARRFAAGHRMRLVLTSDDQQDGTPAIMGFRHAPVGTSSRNTVHSSSRLLFHAN